MESKHNETLVDWLTLKQAAHKLGVHPTTLRRWADAGEILVMLTPGGHRRFAMADVERFAKVLHRQQREDIRRLMGLILRYVAVNEGGEILLEEARVIGRAHAENALGLGLSLVEALQAMLFFRDTMVEVAMQLPEVAHVRPEANQRLLRRINTLINAVQLAIADAYEQARK